MTIPQDSTPTNDPRLASPGSITAPQIQGTAWIFLSVVVLTLVLTWFANSHFLTREALRAGLAGHLSPDRINAQYEQIHRSLWMSYAIVPVYVGVRIILAALLIQLVFLARGNEVKIGALAHACALAYVAVVANTTIDTWTVAHPGSLNGLGSMQSVFPPTSIVSVSFLLHSVSVFELAWCAVVILLIKRASELKYRRIATSVLAGWVTMTGLQIAAVAYIARVIK